MVSREILAKPVTQLLTDWLDTKIAYTPTLLQGTLMGKLSHKLLGTTLYIYAFALYVLGLSIDPTIHLCVYTKVVITITQERNSFLLDRSIY